MDTFITIQAVAPPSNEECDERMGRALSWFQEVEDRCSRFDPSSEVLSLAGQIGKSTVVSPLLYEVIRFSLAVADATNGAFDPTVGHRLEGRGFNRNYRTGQTVATTLQTDESATFRDVRLDPDRHAVTLLKPLILDLGGVAKGFAIDLAARELEPFGDYAIDAGGDVYVHGHGPTGEAWRVGIRHPRQADGLIDVIAVSNTAVCTSGDYERRGTDGSNHVIDPRTGRSANAVASVTVIAPNATLADALGTAAFVLGPRLGIRLLQRQGVDALVIADDLERYTTPGYSRFRR